MRIIICALFVLFLAVPVCGQQKDNFFRNKDSTRLRLSISSGTDKTRLDAASLTNFLKAVRLADTYVRKGVFSLVEADENRVYLNRPLSVNKYFLDSYTMADKMEQTYMKSDDSWDDMEASARMVHRQIHYYPWDAIASDSKDCLGFSVLPHPLSKLLHIIEIEADIIRKRDVYKFRPKAIVLYVAPESKRYAISADFFYDIQAEDYGMQWLKRFCKYPNDYFTVKHINGIEVKKNDSLQNDVKQILKASS